jgi:hypothetical protein
MESTPPLSNLGLSFLRTFLKNERQRSIGSGLSERCRRAFGVMKVFFYFAAKVHVAI